MLAKKLPHLLPRFPVLASRCASHLARQQYDVIVVGGGHAGTEAAAAAARVGAETLLVTQKILTIGALSCNPSLGGVGKGQLVKEVDALDGLCGRAGDWAGIHFSILNRRKGPAVWGPRAQLDRQRYREFIQAELLSTPRLTVVEGSVEELLVTEANPEEPGCHRVTGIRLANGSHSISASSVVLTTGTFLSGSLFVGQTMSPGGRIGDAPSSAGLSHTLRERLGLRVGRLRTGTPPRIVKDSVDLSLADIHPPDSHPTPFSFLNTHTRCKPEEQLPCYLTYTTPGVDRVVRESLHLNCHIQEDTKGPRYCPSIESRVLRFPGRRHQVWLEPEGLTSDLLYPQGLSMTMPPDIQLRLIREIPPLHRAEIHTPGYGVQYDFVCPTQLSPALQVKSTHGLFLAGQINGTTGYEEAAAQVAACFTELQLDWLHEGEPQQDGEGPKWKSEVTGRRDKEGGGFKVEVNSPEQWRVWKRGEDACTGRLGRVETSGRCDKRVSAKMKGKVYKTVVRPATLFGLKTVPLKKIQEAELEGLWAGVNAARSSLSMPPVSLSRTESYIGVLIDDLVSRGVTEPYRMFTSRAEFRTSLRPDNADLRLTLKGFEEVGCVSSLRYREAVRARDNLQDALAALQAHTLSTTNWRKKLQDVQMSEVKSTVLTGMDVLRYKDVTFDMLASAFPESFSPYIEFAQRLKIEAVYRPHCDLQRKEIERIQKEENMSLPQDLDYFSLPVSLSQEVREILDRVRPSTLGAATRLQGMTPAAIVHLLNYVSHIAHKERRKHRNRPEQKEEKREEELCARNASLPQ